MNIYFLINNSRPAERSPLRRLAEDIARRRQITPFFGFVDRQRENSTEELIDEALTVGCTRIAIAGGDGSLNRVINILARTGRLPSVELAIIPAGTCNDFARSLRLSRRRLRRAIDDACTGEGRATDLGRMDHFLFLNNAGFGRRPANTFPRVPGGEAGGIHKTFRTLRSFRPISLQATWDQGSIHGAYFMGIACNGPYFSGGLHFTRGARIHDGLLDVYLIPAMRKWRLMSHLAIAKLGRRIRIRNTVALRVQRLVIEAETDIWPQVDGEPAQRACRRVEFSIAAEKAIIVVPPLTAPPKVRGLRARVQSLSGVIPGRFRRGPRRP